MFGNLLRILPANNPQNLRADCQLVFDDHTNVIPHGKTPGPAKVTGDIIEVFENLSDGNEPNENFEKAQKRRQKFLTPSDIDNAHGADAHIDNAGTKNQSRQNDPVKEGGIRHRYFILSFLEPKLSDPSVIQHEFPYPA